MTEREQLEEAIARIESQRATLGDAVADAALGPMREKLAALTPFHPERAERSSSGRQTDERRLVTVMFADISGFTALAEKRDPEAVRGLMNGCLVRLAAVISRYEGTVDKFLGDAVMALFGAPVAHENDAERALRAALEMLEQVASFGAEQGVDLGVHFGINTGLVVAGNIGSGERESYSVMGDAVNLASRLEDASERGQILVGPDTYRLTAPIFDFEALRPIRVKGKVEPVQVYRLLAAKPRPERVRGLEARGLASPLVGRNAELAMASRCIERLRATGQGGVVGIIGEAGLGKSRLLVEMRSRAQGVIWLEGGTVSFGQTLSYWPFHGILRQYAGVTDGDDEAQAWQKLEDRVRTLFADEAPEILPYLASLLTLEVRGDLAARVQHLDGAAMGRQVLLASRRFFERLAQAHPTVLVIEDLHWADESSLLLLEHLLPLVARAPLLICFLSRPGPESPGARLQEIAARDYAERYTDIRLASLSGDDTVQLARNLLAMEDLPTSARVLIVRRAEGNPFFVEEIIRTLLDTGAVTRDPATGRWQMTGQIEALGLPDTVAGLVMARIDRLDEDAKQVMRIAAVIGRSFLYRLLRTISQATEELDQQLAALQQVDLIREQQSMPELTYMFKHALVQEATYESTLLEQRRALHARVGRAIETLFADRLAELSSLLAYHYARAESWEQAQEYLVKAGDQAGELAADTEALAHYRQAMAAFGHRWDPLQRAVLERKVGEALFRRGEHVQAWEYLQRALADLGVSLPSSRWGVRRAIVRELAEQIGHRLLPGLWPKHATGPASTALEEEVRLLVAMIWMAVQSQPEQFFLLAFKLLNLCERSGFAAGVVPGASALGTAADLIPVFGIAGHYHRQAVAAAEQIGDPAAIGLAYQNLTLHAFHVGEWDAALSHGRLSAETYRRVGDLRGWGMTSLWLASILAHRGDFAQSLALAQEMVRSGEAGADLQVWCWGSWTLGFALRRAGRVEEAAANLRQAIDLSGKVSDRFTPVMAGAELALCYLDQRNLNEALALLEETQRLRVKHDVRGNPVTHLLCATADTLLQAADQASVSEMAGWLRKAGPACRSALAFGRKGARSGLAAALRSQGRFEWLQGRQDAARNFWRQSLAEAGALGLRYDEGLTYLEIGKRTGNRTDLERAEAILIEIGAARRHP